MLTSRRPSSSAYWLLVLSALLGTSDAWSQCVNPANTVASAPAAQLMVCPLGDGPALGAIGSAITVNSTAVPCTGLPPGAFEFDGALPAQICDCLGGIPFAETPLGSGLYTYPGPIAAGGWTLAGTQMKVQGLFVPVIMPIQVNSPDNNGDGVVNLVDIGNLATWFFNGVYDFPADLNGDGVENLADIGLFAPHNGHTCACDPVD